MAATIGKSSHSKWCLNEAMTSGSSAPRKAKNFKQDDGFICFYGFICCYIYIYICYIYIYIYKIATYKTIKRTELTTLKLPL